MCRLAIQPVNWLRLDQYTTLHSRHRCDKGLMSTRIYGFSPFGIYGNPWPCIYFQFVFCAWIPVFVIRHDRNPSDIGKGKPVRDTMYLRWLVSCSTTDVCYCMCGDAVACLILWHPKIINFVLPYNFFSQTFRILYDNTRLWPNTFSDWDQTRKLAKNKT